MSLHLRISFEKSVVKLLDDIGAELFESRDGLFDNCDSGLGKCHVAVVLKLRGDVEGLLQLSSRWFICVEGPS